MTDAGKSPTVLKRDMVTRWNSTGDMAKSVLDHEDEYNTVTASRTHGLRNCELSASEWEIVRQLHEVLKVSFRPLYLGSLSPLTNLV